ncbi:MAG: flagellar hook-length control protein FliK [Solibacillus sp.]
MNIAMLQAMSVKPAQVSAPKSTETATKMSESNSNEFGAVFSSVMSSSTEKTQQATTDTSTSVPAEEVEATLMTDSMKDLFAELGIEIDEAELFAFIGEEGEMVALDQLLNLEDLTAMLDISEEELTEIVAQLLGEEMEEITDVWSLIEQAPAILSQVAAMLQSNEQVPKETHKIVQLLKAIEFVGQKTDTVYQQEFKLTQLTEALKATVVQVQQEAPKVTFQQAVQQATQTTKVETETAQPVQHQQQVTQTKTVTVTLPAEKPAQSEALLKEIQNLMNRSQLSGQPGNMKLLLKLFPENLGQIRIELVQQNGVLTARLLASTAIGKELLDTNLNQLKASFAAQNIQMDRVDVAQSLQETDRGGRDQNFFNNFFRQQPEDKDEEDDEQEDGVSFKDLLNEQQEEVE